MKPKYHEKIGKYVSKIEDYMTEIQRQLDNLYEISNWLYDDFFEEKKEKSIKKLFKKSKGEVDMSFDDEHGTGKKYKKTKRKKKS